jgi:hypothetical protein
MMDEIIQEDSRANRVQGSRLKKPYTYPEVIKPLNPEPSNP